MTKSPLAIVIWIMASLVFATEAPCQQTPGISWKDLKTSKKGTLPVYWFESRPFIFRNEQKQLVGIEYDLINRFAVFIKEKYNFDLKIEWIEAGGFDNIYNRVQQSTSPCFGTSSFSITQEREEQVNFSPPYMSDIMVLISHKNVPMTESAEEFQSVFSKLTAITIRGTTYELELLYLKQKLQMSFDIEYIPSALNILETIEKKENSFGFIDLPVYLMYFSDNPSLNLKRQNFYPVKRKGYGFLIPKKSDWMEPVNDFFNQPSFQQDLELFIEKHLDLQLYRFNENLALQSNTHEELLTKEKEIQNRDLINKSKEIEAKTRANYFLTALVIVSLMFSAITLMQYIKRNQQRLKIEAQQKKIELTNRQLEQRNQHLIALDEEKNNLIKILAHDMRQPLSQVEGLSQLLMIELKDIPADQKSLIQHITDASKRLSKMITNILDVDAIENKRVDFVSENVVVVSLVKTVMESFRTTALKKNITLGLNAHSEELIIKVDSLYLTQILENLISNAIKFSYVGKCVEVSVYQVNNNVRIDVRDEGPGITEEDREKLFKKFQKLSTRPTGGESSIGLGLAIVKKYVELMGGKVWCQSEPGKGATFHVEFKMAND